MRRLSFESPVGLSVLCVFLSVLLGSADSSTGSPAIPQTAAVQSTSLTPTTEPKPPVLSPPGDVGRVTPVDQNETSITLEWSKVTNISTYELHINGTEKIEKVNASSEGPSVEYAVSNLTAGTLYSFTLFTVDGELKSNGTRFQAPTAPRDVRVVTPVRRSETSIDLEWLRVDDISTYTLKYDHNEINVTGSTDPICATVSNLLAGTKYSFTLFTVFEDVNSAGYVFPAVTAPRNTKSVKPTGQTETSITLEWEKVDGIHSYNVAFDDEELTVDASVVSHTISNLTSGKKYNFTFFTKFENVSSTKVHLFAVTAPHNVQTVTGVSQNETSITLQWAKVADSFNYTLVFDGTQNGGIINDESESKSVVHTVFLPHPGRRYTFTLYTVFEYASSTGHTFTASTVPPMVDGVVVTDRSLTSISLQWKNGNSDWKYQLEIDNCDSDCTAEPDVGASGVVSHTVQHLRPGTKYTFWVTTLFEHQSKPFEVVTLTVIDCGGVPWQTTSTSVQATVVGEFTTAAIRTLTGSPIQTSDNVSFTGLYPGDTYYVTLKYETTKGPLLQCEHKLTLPPSDPVGRCEYEASGYSIRVVWDQPDGVCTGAEVDVSGNRHVAECKKRHAVVSGFEPARTYRVSLSFLSGEVRSQTASVFDCGTDPRGVIAGSVMAVLIIIILVCVALFIVFKRPDLIRRKKSSIRGSKLSLTKAKLIPMSLFPCHFSELSLDDHRGFRQEYESLGSVGRKQSQDAAELQENAARNRFTNVLPYDWNRVKLTTSDSFESTDYINASYMPGYKSNREFIATQGPLPSTLNDFWRMIWEQQVKGIVMVTNCTELGRTKCEQYWPADGQCRSFKELTVTTVSEQQLPDWTLRNLSVQHKTTSEERTVRHFHFTAWPDHGVPQGTDVLIQFRGLVREHIERDAGRAPTVVHCSAGVGRTGTLIALDALLQQLEKEQGVAINALVHRMRLNRPYMVQTESQYVFLHQCILDSLRSTEKTDDHIYENATDTIYVNATALQDLGQKDRNTESAYCT